MAEKKTPKSEETTQGAERIEAVTLALGIAEDIFSPPAAELLGRLDDAQRYDDVVEQKHKEIGLWAPWFDNALVALNPKILETAKLNAQDSSDLYHRDFLYDISAAVFAFAYMRGLRAGGMEEEAILKRMRGWNIKESA